MREREKSGKRRCRRGGKKEISKKNQQNIDERIILQTLSVRYVLLNMEKADAKCDLLPPPSLTEEANGHNGRSKCLAIGDDKH